MQLQPEPETVQLHSYMSPLSVCQYTLTVLPLQLLNPEVVAVTLADVEAGFGERLKEIGPEQDGIVVVVVLVEVVVLVVVEVVVVVLVPLTEKQTLLDCMS